MKDRERLRGASHSEQIDHIQDSKPPVSSTHASTRNDEQVSMSPRAEAKVFDREQHSPQTQPAAPDRKASSVDIWEYRRLKEQVRALTEERNELREENSRLRQLLNELQEIRDKEERRKEKDRQRMAKYREANREEYNARQAKLMRERYAKQKQEANSTSG